MQHQAMEKDTRDVRSSIHDRERTNVHKVFKGHSRVIKHSSRVPFQVHGSGDDGK